MESAAQGCGKNGVDMSRTILVLLLLIGIYQTEAVVAQTQRNQQQGDAKQQLAVSQASSIPSVQPDVEQPKAGDASDRADNKTQITIDDTRSNAPTWVSVVVSGLLLLVIAFQAWIYKEQLKEMRKLSKLSNRQAFTLKRQVRAMFDQLEAMQAQVRTSERQADLMRDTLTATQRQVEIMGIAIDPRLRITNVSVEDLEVGKEPVFIVSIMNDGATDAKDVLLNISVEMKDVMTDEGRGHGKEWSNPQVVTIPARQEQHYFVPWNSALKREDIDAIETKSISIKVSGYFKLGDCGQTEFCYMYYPWKGNRPDRVSQFIACDFDPALTTLITVTAYLTPTGELTAHIKREKEEEEKPDEGGLSKKVEIPPN